MFSQDATEGYKRVIGDQLRRDPGFLVSDAFDAYQNVVHHKGVYPGVFEIKYYYTHYFKKMYDA